MGLENEKKEQVIEFNITIACPVCNTFNTTIYIPNHRETFMCTKCGQRSIVMMSFLAIKDNEQPVQTMMVDTKQFEKRKLNTRIGGVVSGDKFIKRDEFPDSGGV